MERSLEILELGATSERIFLPALDDASSANISAPPGGFPLRGRNPTHFNVNINCA